MSRSRTRRTGAFGLRHPLLLGAGAAVSAAVVIVAVVLALAGGDGGRSWPLYPYEAETFTDQGTQHLGEGETFDGYASNPPTSGPHTARAAPWGVADSPVPREVAIHNLEHGGVVIWYNCEGGAVPLDEPACEELRSHLANATNQLVGQGKRVLMTPYPQMESRIALTAWTTLDAFDEFELARIVAFVDAFEGKLGPEA